MQTHIQKKVSKSKWTFWYRKLHSDLYACTSYA